MTRCMIQGTHVAVCLLAALTMLVAASMPDARATVVTTSFVYGDFPNNPSLTAEALYDDAAITGAGTEVVPVGELRLDMRTTSLNGFVVTDQPFSIVYVDGTPAFLNGGQFIVAGFIGLTFTGLGTGFKRAIVRCCTTVDQRFLLASVGTPTPVGTVPAPATLTILLPAVAGLHLLRRRRSGRR